MRHHARLLPALLLLLFAAACCGDGRGDDAATSSWRASAAASAARASRLLQETPPPDPAACAATWSLPYARAAQLPPGYPRDSHTGNESLRLELFILYQVDPPLVLDALRSLRGERGLAVNVTMLDNSAARDLSDGADAPTRQALAALGGRLRVHTPVVPMDFQQSQNAVQELAYAARCDAWFVMHSDAALLPGSAAHLAPLARQLVRQRWRAPQPEQMPVGVAFFSYDALALFNPAATLATGVWDVNFGLGYGADVDYYHRLKLAGFSTPNADDPAFMGPAAASLGRRVNVTHEGSHSLKSAAFACTRELRMSHTFEAEWRGRYLHRKWGQHWNGSRPFDAG